MKKIFSLFAITSILGLQLSAQPSQTQVKTDFLKNGVTAVESIKTDKEIHLDHFMWKATFRSIQPVKPQEVDGVEGVTLVQNIEAYYECTGNNCSKKWSEVTQSEYKGIDLPPPSNKDVAEIIKQKMFSEPSELVTTMALKTSFDSVKVEEPKVNWISPGKVQIAAKLYFNERANSSENAAIESPIVVTLVRENSKSPFAFSNAIQYYEKNVELSRKVVREESSKGKGKEEPIRVPLPPVAGAWKTGDKVKVQENGKWYLSTVLHAREGEWYVRYDEYDPQFNEWVKASRIKNR